jgi:hypothetical protein
MYERVLPILTCISDALSDRLTRCFGGTTCTYCSCCFLSTFGEGCAPVRFGAVVISPSIPFRALGWRRSWADSIWVLLAHSKRAHTHTHTHTHTVSLSLSLFVDLISPLQCMRGMNVRGTTDTPSGPCLTASSASTTSRSGICSVRGCPLLLT